jgi:hypothetical protein
LYLKMVVFHYISQTISHLLQINLLANHYTLHFTSLAVCIPLFQVYYIGDHLHHVLMTKLTTQNQTLSIDNFYQKGCSQVSNLGDLHLQNSNIKLLQSASS